MKKIILFLFVILLVNILYSQGTWTNKASMPTPRTSAGSAVVNGKIYVIGGYEIPQNVSTNIVEEYNPATDTWTTKTPMPTTRQGFGVAVVDNKIYCIGGSLLNTNRLTVNEEYDPSTDTWTTKASMPTQRTALSCESVNGKIYAMGGRQDWSSLSAVIEAYDPVTNIWTSKQPMPTGNAAFASVAYDNLIHVFGGGSAGAIFNVHQVYNPLTNSWSSLASLPNNICGMSAESINNKIYIIGGLTDSGYTGTNEVYDPVSNSWSSETNMITARAGLCMENVNNKLYAIGGHSDGDAFSINEEFSPSQTFTKQEVGLIPVNYGNKRCVQFVDVNNDGLLDLFATGSTDIGGWGGSTMIYLNNGDNTFTQLTGLPFSGFFGSEADWGDYDNDGFLDLLISAEGEGSPGGGGTRIYKNNGNNTFTQVFNIPRGFSIQWLDYNNDGKLDFVMSEATYYSAPFTIKIYRNDGNDVFSLDTGQSFPTTNTNGYPRICRIDYDNDGYMDLIVLGTDNSGAAVSYLFKNNGDGTFSTMTSNLLPPGGSGSLAFSDYNNDGFLDIYQNDGSFYLNNSGDGTFSSVALNSVIAMAGGNDIGDFNNDGLPDILTTGSMATVINTKVYRNDGNNSFTDIQSGITSLAMWSSVKWGDYDNDGYLDFLLAGYLHTDPYKATELWKSSGGGTPNTIPTSPVSLSSSINGNKVTLNWNKASDGQTNQNALTYNVRIGTSPGNSDVYSCAANPVTGFRRIAQIGNASTALNFIIDSLTIGATYYWSVQAIDLAYAGGAFATEESFTITDPITDCLVAYYPFNENANDESGNGNNGTINGPVLTSDRFGNPDAAYLFDGSDHIYVSASPSINTINNEGTTICAWIKTIDYIPITAPSILYYGVGTGQPAFCNIIWDTLVNACNFISQANRGDCYSTKKIYPENWYFVTNVFDEQNAVMKIFVNGVLDGEEPYNISNPINPRIEIGRDPYAGGSQYFNGVIDDIRIFNCALDSAHIWELYLMDGIILNLPDTIMACHDESIELDAGAGFTSYLWSTGQNTQTIIVTETGTFSVTVEDAFGHTATDSTYVNIINVQIAQNDTTICAGQSLELSLTGSLNTSTEGLVGYWPFNGNADDGSGNGNNGTVNGAIPSQDRFGNANSAYSFDGTDDYINIPTTSSLNPTGKIGYSVSGWVKINAYYGQFFCLRGWPYQNTYEILIESYEYIGYMKFCNWINPCNIILYSNSPVSIGVWHFFCLNIDHINNVTDLYLDNALQSTSMNNISIPNFNSGSLFDIGRNTNGGGNFNGQIDDIRIYNRALNSDELQNLYLEGLGNYSYLWSTGDIIPTITVIPDENTTYYVDITDGINVCSDSITVTVNEINLNLPDTLLACHQESILLDAGAGFTSYLWNTGQTTQTLAVTETGTYIVSVEDALGCMANDSTYVNIINLQIAQNDTTIFAGESIGLSIMGGDSANINNGLVAWYPFNGNANDESGNGNNGNVYGSSLSVDRFGNENGCYSFNGAENYIYINASSSLNTATNLSTTINTWVNVMDYNYDNPSLIYYGVDYSQPTFCNIIDDSLVRAANYLWQLPYGNCYSSTKIIPNEWYFVSYVYDKQNSLIKVYVNGVFENQTSYTVTNPVNPHLEFGRDPYGGGSQFFNGKLDDIRIFNRALTDNEIQKLYFEGLGDYSCLWSTGETTPFITVSPSQTTTYYVEITDGINTCTDSVTITVIPIVNLDLKVFLQGPYLYYNMTPFLNLFGYLPLVQPYNVLPWNYNGTEAINSVPNTNVIDWVLVELRESSGDVSMATEQTIIARKAGLILRSGKIVDLDGASPLLFQVNITDNLFAMVMHRNHLPVISANPLIESNGIYAYDFTNSLLNIYGGENSCSNLGNGLWGLSSGNGNADAQIDNQDKNDVWLLQLGTVGYKSSDYNMDGQVDNSDKIVKWGPNTGKGKRIP